MVDEDLEDVLKKITDNDAIEFKNKGNEYFNAGDYENAIQFYKKAIAIDPNYLSAWNNLGLAYIKLGKIDEAKKCQEAIKFIKTTQKNIETQPKEAKKQEALKIQKPSIRIPTDISLTDNEVPIWFGHMSWIANWPILLIAFILIFTIIGIIISIFLFAIAWINVEKSEYFISNKRIYTKYGFISRVANDIKIEWVTNTSIRQGFFGRILNYGDLLIASPGTHTGTSLFRGVSDPMKVKGIIEDIIAKTKKI